MSGDDRYYSELGRSYQPGAINQVAFAALELKKQGKRLITLTGGLYDPDSVPYEPVKEVLSEASPEDWRGILQYGNTMGSPGLREALSHFMAGHAQCVPGLKRLVIARAWRRVPPQVVAARKKINIEIDRMADPGSPRVDVSALDNQYTPAPLAQVTARAGVAELEADIHALAVEDG